MAIEPTLNLREVARGLAGAQSSPRAKINDGALLALLRAGELKAGFEFPGLATRWIPIPETYWLSVGSDKFRSVRRRRNDEHMTGTYKVRIGQFAKEYLQIVSQHVGEGHKPDASSTSIDQILNELQAAFGLTLRRFEVVIREEEWLNYLQRHKIPDPTQREKPSGGRREKTSWRHLVPLITGYMMTLDHRPEESRDHFYIATRIHELAKKQGISDLPSPTTLEKAISEILAEAETFSKS